MRKKLDRGAAGGSLVDQNDANSSHWLDAFRSSLWSRGSSPHGTRIQITSSAPYDELEQEQLRQDDALLLEEDRLQAAVRAARYQQALRRYHSRKVNARSLEEGNLVLRHVQSAKNSNKLTPKWEGPYRVKRVTRPGAVRLETEDGIPVSNSWNIEHLRKFYP